MALINLEVICGRVVRGEQFVETPQWSMIMEAKLSDPLTVTTGEAAEDFKIEVVLRPISEPTREFFRKHGEGWEKAIGHIDYSAAQPASEYSPGHRAVLSFEFFLDETDMAKLLDFACAGRLPSWIGTESNDVEWDDAPFGSGKKWDTASKPLAPLTRIAFSIRIIEAKQQAQKETSASPPVVGAGDVVAELKNLMAGMAVWQKRTTYVLIGLAAILLLRLIGI